MPRRFQKYVYERLVEPDSIRLVELQPAESTDEQVSCKLTHVRLSESSLEYEGLSYAWGDLRRTRVVLCDGSYICVTANLKSALRRLRHRSAPRLLWIDAISINQKDIDERSQQVTLMVQIYSRARQVVIWIGKADSHRDRLLEAIAEIDPMPYIEEQRKMNEGDVMKWPVWSLPRALQGKHLKGALNDLLCHPWFRRVWIQQEVAFASSAILLCGKKMISWDQVAALEWAMRRELQAGRRKIGLSSDANFSLDCINTIQRSRAFMRREPAKQSMLHILEVCRRCDASDPKDKIYGLLSFDRDHWLDGAFRPDYSITLEELYNNVAKQMLRARRLKILQYAGRHQQLHPNLCSWAVDWTYKAGVEFPGERTRDACGDTPMEFRIQSSRVGDVLIISGLVLASIKKLGPVSDIFNSLPNSAERFKVAQEMLNQSISMVSPDSTYFTGENSRAAFVRTLTANNFPEYDNGSLDLIGSYEAWERWIQSEGRDGSSKDDHEILSIAFKQSSAYRERRFCLTDNGYMCLLPALCKKGDFVCLLWGYRVPVILRKRLQFFELLGDCYIHGFMGGEAFARRAFVLNNGEETPHNNSTPVLKPSHGAMADKKDDQDEFALPPGWEQTYTKQKGNARFRHAGLSISTQDDPRTSHAAGPVPDGWTSGRARRRRSGWKAFFVNLKTGETTWQDPCLPKSGPVPPFRGFRLL